MRVYLAARYSRKNEIKALVPLFGAHGISVGSRWLHETSPPEVTLLEVTPEFCQETALVDLEDIEAADMLVFFAEDPLVGTPRGGRHVEFGFALGIGKRIAVIGGPENIFHHLSQVVHYPDVKSFLEKEKRNAPVAN
jgi:hypothetical protein